MVGTIIPINITIGIIKQFLTFLEQNKRMNGMKEHIPHLFYQFVNCIQHIVIV